MEYSILDVFRNLDREKRTLLAAGEMSVLLEYIYFWNNHGRKNNRISPRNSAICNVCGFTKKTFYKYRKGLVEKGFIIVKSYPFKPVKDGKHKHAQGQGRQHPATISLADWLVKSNKVSVIHSEQKNISKKTLQIQSKDPIHAVSITKLKQYGKNLAAQIGATTAVYPRQLDRIKSYESKISVEVVKHVRKYVEKHTNSNPWKYYESTMESIIANHVENMTDLENYNYRLAGKKHKPVQQQLPLLSVVNNNGKKYKTKYYHGKLVEQGTDWSKKKAKTYTAEELDAQARNSLHMKPDEPFTGKWATMTPAERSAEALHECFVALEKGVDL